MRISINTEPCPDYPTTPYAWAITKLVDGEEHFTGIAGWASTIKQAFEAAHTAVKVLKQKN